MPFECGSPTPQIPLLKIRGALGLDEPSGLLELALPGSQKLTHASLPDSLTSHLLLEISYSGSLHTMEISKGYKSGIIFSWRAKVPVHH